MKLIKLALSYYDKFITITVLTAELKNIPI